MSESKRSGTHDPIPLAEWITAAVGLVLVLATVGILVREGLRRDGRPPEITLRVVDVTGTASGWVARFEAHNAGDEVAANLEVAGEIVAGDSVLESASAVIDYLPSGARRSGGLHFRRAPADGTLRLHPVGYQKP